MSTVRPLVQDSGGLGKNLRGGDAVINCAQPQVVATDGNISLTVTDVLRGVISFSGFTAGRNLTVPTAALLLAAAPNLEVGESLVLEVGISVAYAGTLVTATGITLKGAATIPASGKGKLYFTKTSATTMDCLVI